MPLDARVLDDVDDADLAFQFGTGSLALDLTATVGERGGRRFERLRLPADLARWLREAGLAPRARPTEDDLAKVRDLRSAVFDLAEARRQGRTPPAGAHRLINMVAAEDTAPPRLTRTWE